MKRLKVLFDDRPVGELLAQDGIHYFSYDTDWLKAPLPLSPYELPATVGVTEHRKGCFLALPGLCYDSLPDRFGMTVMRRSLRDQGIQDPTPLQMLSYLGDRTMGALIYEPAGDEPGQAEFVDLIEVARSARQVMAHEHGEALDPAIVKAGATAGGMMPKILAAISKDGSEVMTGAQTVPDEMEAWLIKLNTNDKEHSQLIQLEHAYFSMARTAGLRVPATLLIPDRNGLQHFAIRRFYRSEADPNRRIHTQTYASIAGIDYREPTEDYEKLLRLTKHLTRNYQDVCEQFRRMLFNVLAGNRDDHAKNFSFCMDDSGEWTLSPAYDLLFTDNDLGGNWMMVQGRRSAIRKDDFARLADLMGIHRAAFASIIDEVKEALQQWPVFAKKSGVGPGLSNVIKASIQNTLQLL
jgi:serine/threonine-protein kinase HipA